jgi:aldehyde dehydrogenase (NAD+)
VRRALERFGGRARGPFGVLIGGRELGELLVEDQRVPVVSATGSTAMGRQVGPKLAARFARAILELGGNNAAIVAPSADLDLALRAVAFAAMGTAGQRCTTLRRLFVHESVYDRSCRASRSLRIRDDRRSREDGVWSARSSTGPPSRAWSAPSTRRAAGGNVHGGGRVPDAGAAEDAFYVRPALVEMPSQTGPMLRETFAPDPLRDALPRFRRGDRPHNASAPGLSSSIFTLDMREAEPSCRRPAPIAASPTSTSAPRAPRSAAPSAARRRRAAAARPAPTLEGLHAPRHQHHQLRTTLAPGAGRQVRRRVMSTLRQEPTP